MKLALVFPGQGSQSIGMMEAYGDAPVVRATFDEASAALGQDLWQLAAEGPAEALALTVNTQPLMLAAGVAVYRLWRERGGAEPALVAGHSLGEYSALVAAGALEFRDAVPLVRLRARAMQEAVAAGQGAMAAILDLDEEGVGAACAEAAQGEVVSAANFNGPGQTVIAGHAAAVARAAAAARAKGAKRAVMLPVSAPFHCSLMRSAGDKLQAHLETLAVACPRVPVLHNADVQAHGDPQAIREALVRQAYSPVRWSETIQAMAQQGVTHVYECGPGKVLAGLTRRIAGTLQGGALADADSLEQALAETK
ncbi:MAG TPA: ACP S-malonyltransferase [Burkholderiales bacterium]|nr:ACP S-malonyltransferase [Burkholderiales bacterium]